MGTFIVTRYEPFRTPVPALFPGVDVPFPVIDFLLGHFGFLRQPLFIITETPSAYVPFGRFSVRIDVIQDLIDLSRNTRFRRDRALSGRIFRLCKSPFSPVIPEIIKQPESQQK